jgi:hypothetical protein
MQPEDSQQGNSSNPQLMETLKQAKGDLLPKLPCGQAGKPMDFLFRLHAREPSIYACTTLLAGPTEACIRMLYLEYAV